MRRVVPKDLHEFQPLLVEIEDRPLNPLGRSILWIVVFAITFGTLWLFIGKIDVVVSARGKVVPSGEIKILQPMQTGVISKILVKEGDSVKKGQVLMQIDPSVTKTSLKSKQKDFIATKTQVQRLKALVENKEFKPQENSQYQKIIDEQQRMFAHQINSIKQTKEQFKIKKSQATSQLLSTKSEAQRLKALLDNEKEREARLKEVLDIIAKNEYDKVHSSVLNYIEQLNIANHKIKEARKKLDEISREERIFEEQSISKWYNELSTKQKELRELESNINVIKFQNKKQQLIAPLDGYIGKLMIHTEGGVVTPAEKLISLIPKKAPLIIKATVLNKDIGFVTKGMNAAIKIDTFSFQKYGLIDANVTNIGNDAIEDKKLGLVYEIKLKPLQLSLNVEGNKKYLEPGMSVTAEIKVGKRRIIEFFIYPLIKYLDEGMSVR